jgi:hypothetical protein
MAPGGVVIAIDTNLLVYAHRRKAPEHRRAQRAIEAACADSRGWGISFASVSEFWAVVTHPACSGRPSSPAEASAFLRSLAEDGRMQTWPPGVGFAERLTQFAVDLDVSGVRIFDLQIALTAFEHGAHELWTHDADFVRIPGLRLRDPLA